MISVEGRRLSLEEHEIHRQLNLPRETLDRLVAARLLRSESRADSPYYELSHDALVEPVLASNRYKARALAMLGIGYGALLMLGCVILAVSGAFAVLSNLSSRNDWGDVVAIVLWACFVVVVSVPIVVLPATLLRGSVRSWRRYRRLRKSFVASPEPPSLVGTTNYGYSSTGSPAD